VQSGGSAGEQVGVRHVVRGVAEVAEGESGEPALALADRLQVGEQLARVEPVGERVDHRHRAERGHLLDALLLVRPPYDRGDLAGQHPGDVADRFARADAGEPAVDRDRLAAEFGDADREGQLGAQGRLVEQQRDRLRAGERTVPVPVGLHRVGEVEHLDEFVRSQVVVAQEMSRHLQRPPARQRAAGPLRRRPPR
jgi:hypothetical protein